MSDEDKPEGGFVPLASLKSGTTRSPAEIIAEIRRIYFGTSQKTIEHDFAHAIELLKSLPDEETRDRAAVYMEGIAEMRKEWRSGKVKRQKSKVRSKVRSKSRSKVKG